LNIKNLGGFRTEKEKAHTSSGIQQRSSEVNDNINADIHLHVIHVIKADCLSSFLELQNAAMNRWMSL
jgi:hypothetical protein